MSALVLPGSRATRLVMTRDWDIQVWSSGRRTGLEI